MVLTAVLVVLAVVTWIEREAQKPSESLTNILNPFSGSEELYGILGVVFVLVAGASVTALASAFRWSDEPGLSKQFPTEETTVIAEELAFSPKVKPAHIEEERDGNNEPSTQKRSGIGKRIILVVVLITIIVFIVYIVGAVLVSQMMQI